MKSSLDLGIIGNCSFAALIDKHASVVWCCLPRFDSDPVFHALLGGPSDGPRDGTFDIVVEGLKKTEQCYLESTAVLRTVLHGNGGAIEVFDFAPRFVWRDRQFRPLMIVRRIRPLSGSPRVTLRVRPRFEHGAQPPTLTRGSNHIRYIGPKQVLRMTSDGPIDYIVDETTFNLDREINVLIGPDETPSEGPSETARSFQERTEQYWRAWTHRLALPFEWQDEVIRAAITLKLCTYEPTGAIVAAITTSVPEAPGTQRNWDYRYCWVRDAVFVVRALNSLSAVRTMENYVSWLMNVVAGATDDHVQPVYGVGLERELIEQELISLPGYRGMGPVRVGNQAYEHFQHDSYGHVVMGAAQAFLDKRLLHAPSKADFRRLEAAGSQALRLFDKPDAGMWELRSRARVHTTSSVMCWAACDRLGRIAGHIGEMERATFWRQEAERIKSVIMQRSWSDQRAAFVESFEGEHLDAGVLLMPEVGFISATDPRFVSTMEQLERTLGRGAFMMRYEAADDFGMPETAFNVCAFWRVSALARAGRREEAREYFEALLASSNHLGLLSEDTHPDTGELWGNFPQTYSMVGIINGAMLLSRSWEEAV